MTALFLNAAACTGIPVNGSSVHDENSAACSESLTEPVSAVLHEQIALDEGVDYFSAQGALAAYRLGRIA